MSVSVNRERDEVGFFERKDQLTPEGFEALGGGIVPESANVTMQFKIFQS